jgi:hypothetical protein
MKAELRSGRHAAPVVIVPYLQLDPLFSVRGLRISVPKSHVVMATAMASLVRILPILAFKVTRSRFCATDGSACVDIELQRTTEHECLFKYSRVSVVQSEEHSR